VSGRDLDSAAIGISAAVFVMVVIPNVSLWRQALAASLLIFVVNLVRA
jgi:hypothetical protein